MNRKMLLFSGVVSMTLGTGLGVVLANLLPSPYSQGTYRNQKPIFMIVGATGGFLFGVGMEAIRELKQKQDQE